MCIRDRGRIDWSANVVNAENINNAGSFAPPSTWEELKLALLDILMPANSVEECAIKSATFQTERRDCIRLRTPFPSAYVPMRIGCRTPCQRTYALGCDNRHPLATQFATRSATIAKWRKNLSPHSKRLSSMPVAVKLHASLVVQPLSVPCHSRLSPTAMLSDSLSLIHI